MTSVDLATPGSVLAIGAHPDDVEFGCGATLAKWAAAGSHVEILVLTDGSKGSWDPEIDPAKLVATRRAEQAEAALVLGVAAVHELGVPDGELLEDPDAMAAVCAVIRRCRPNVVVGHDPWKRYRLHPDHRHAGFLTLDAVVAARDPHFFPGLEEPHRPDHVLVFEADEVHHVERVEQTLEAKIEALLCHRSQWRSTHGIDPGGSHAEVGADMEAFRSRIRSAAIEAGALAGVPLGESFAVVAGI